jgi:hypothetical protein
MMSELGLNDNHDSYTDGSSSNNAARYTAAGAGVATAAASAGSAYDGNNSSSSNTNYQFAAVRGGSSSNSNTNNSSWAPSVLHELTLSTSEGPNSNESVEMAQYVSTRLMFSTKCTASPVLRGMFKARAGVLLATCYDCSLQNTASS